jgi:hypothetical protein
MGHNIGIAEYMLAYSATTMLCDDLQSYSATQRKFSCPHSANHLLGYHDRRSVQSVAYGPHSSTQRHLRGTITVCSIYSVVKLVAKGLVLEGI